MSEKEEFDPEKIPYQTTNHVNYLFFGFILLILGILHSIHIFLIEPSFTFSRYFFLMYSMAQCLLEVTGFICLFVWIQSYLPKKLNNFFLVAAFLLLITQVIDFFLERLIDISIWYGINFVSGESIGNFIELLRATSVPLSSWILGVVILTAVIYLGLLLYKGFDVFSKKKPIYFSRRLAVSCGMGAFFFLFVWDTIFSPFAHDGSSRQYLKALPWKTTFFPPDHEVLLVDGCLKDPWKDKDCFSGLDSRPFSLQRKPDIFLFIAESLREDFITQEISPNLSQFRSDSIHFPLALSNANATHISWFSYFYSLFPFHYPNYQIDQWKKGSVPLILLKKMGYEINLYSASRMGFYQMDEMLFGEGSYLLDKSSCYSMEETIPPYEADEKAIAELCKDIKKQERSGGRVFIVFLDSTHFGYSFPDDVAPLFTPIDDKINYLEAAISTKNIEKIKNRYRNAIHYVDSLFGDFIETLKETPSWDESIVVFTADHGEEFYEYGHLFHATDLSKPQLNVPLYYKMGKGEVKGKVSSDYITSHMDIFPSILHYLVGEDCFQEVLQGHSIFSSKKWPFVVGARYNAGRSPYEFFIHNGNQKLIAQFDNKNDIFHSRALHILATKNDEEENVPFSLSIIHQHFGEAIDTLFSP